MFGKLNYHILLAAIVLLLATSCEKVIELKLDNAEPQLVIEGVVTNQSIVQTVKITQSVPFSNSNTFPPVSGATVTITDNHNGVFNLTETAPGVYSSIRFTGRVGYTYTMNVVVNGKTYTGSSTMPGAVRFDDLSYKDGLFDAGKKLITIHYSDPLNVPNQYHFVMYVNRVQVKTILDDDDNFTNGKYVDRDLYQDNVDIKLGDTVVVDAQCVDKNVFTYWFSLSQQQNNGAAAPTPSNPPSNLSNNALGYFSAHTSQRLGIIIK